MNTSPWLEIIVISISILFVGFLIGRYIYRRSHHLPVGDCECCKAHSLVKDYHKAYSKKVSH